MFITKRVIAGKQRFYLEETISQSSKRLKISVAINDNSELLTKFTELKNKVILELAKETIKKYKLQTLNFSEVIELEKLKYNYKLFKYFFPESFIQFDKDEFIRFAQGSASVEGNTLSLQQATQVIEKEVGVTGKSLFEIKEIQNLKLTKEFLQNKKEVSEKVIKKIHRLIMDGFSTKTPGEYRTSPVYILGSTHKPLIAEKVPAEMKKLMKFYQTNKQLHPVELASYIHIYFESIHPFLDGNGRTGREIMNFILQKNKYCRAIINLDNRETYIALLERLQESKEYYKFTKFVYSCLLERSKALEQVIIDNQKEIINQLRKKLKIQ
ncbi:MAG: Fic family protein [archaeon]|jgi:Fic family protein